MGFQVGDKVQLVHGLVGEAQNAPSSLPQPDGPNTVYVVTRKATFGDNIFVRPADNPRYKDDNYGDYYQKRFKAAEIVAPALGTAKENKVLSKNAFSLIGARQAREQLVQAGVARGSIRIRTRSWDTDGTYFAVDVTDGKVTDKLYHEQAVADFIAAIKPIDVVPYMTSTRLNGTVTVYQFASQAAIGARGFIPAPDGSYWWTEADIRKARGIVSYAGKRYRLGRHVFQPFVG